VRQSATSLNLYISMALALGDALAAEVMHRKGFSEQQFARVHPGGGLGKRFTTIGDVLKLHARRAVPRVQTTTLLLECLREMSDKHLGMTTVEAADGAVGVLSDGDLRRCLEERGAQALVATAGELCAWAPSWIPASHLASEALGIMEGQKITAVLVGNADGELDGVVHLHDLWGLQLI
jgi:arabinose-5-phosphate isomerase